VRDRTGTGSRIAIGEAALIRVHAVGKPKIIEIADQLRTGAGSKRRFSQPPTVELA
jgi:hypothetical protein